MRALIALVTVGSAVIMAGLAACVSGPRSSCDGRSQEPIGLPQPVAVLGVSLDPVKAAFNSHADRPRVVLLVSPTCSECIHGAKAVEREVIERFARSGVTPIVVWTRMLDGDDEAAARASSGIFADAGGEQFYDGERRGGWAFENEVYPGARRVAMAALPPDHWMRERAADDEKPGPQWDLYMLYKPGVRWDGSPPKPDAFIRHVGRDRRGESWFWRDRFDTPPLHGDLFEAMGQMGADVLGGASATPMANGEVMKIELLGFPGCTNTPAMRDNLAAALSRVGPAETFEEVNQEALPALDARRGWPAPTVLVNGRDLFGMAPPAAPSTGCRIYEDGVPTATTIASKLKGLAATK